MQPQPMVQQQQMAQPMVQQQQMAQPIVQQQPMAQQQPIKKEVELVQQQQEQLSYLYEKEAD